MSALTAPPRSPGRLATLARGAWLGWKVESNWADPFVFASYVLLKPMAAALTVIVMIRVVSGAPSGSDVFLFGFLGAAFQGFFTNVLGGMSMVVIEDREFHETLHYVYISPSCFAWYLLGRASVRLALTAFSVAMVLAMGTLLLGLPLAPARIDLPLLAGSLALGFACLTAIGVVVAGLALMLTHRVWYLMEAVAGVLFFFSGCLFPLHELPAPLRAVSYLAPTTYWMELVRRALAPQTLPLSSFPETGNAMLLAVLAVAAVATTAVAAGSFAWFSERARRLGYIHRKTHF